MNKVENRGSQWRIWDLHVHSPKTYGGDYSTFITNLENSEAAVIGINDYCSIDGYDEVVKLGGVLNKVIFPIVELRMNNLLNTKKNPNGIKINFHIIFDNCTSVISKIRTWLSSLECFDEKGIVTQLGVASDPLKVSFDYNKTIESLKKFDLHYKHSLIWLPYDEYGGIDEIDPIIDGYFKLSLINEAHILGSSTKKQIDFFKWVDPKYTKEQYESFLSKPKPCMKGSDAHKINYPFGRLQNEKSEPIEKYCWINADMTFNGLKQILVEPNRVFIGAEPDLLIRVRQNKTKFIRSVSVTKQASTVLDDIWFRNFNIQINNGLVAIIGNKGSGKSAITDIISLCGNTHQDKSNFSFLTPSKFRKVRPYNLSEKFSATLTWEDGSTITKRLDENPDKLKVERVKYIPQNFLERLCTDIDSDEFEKELKQIIYSHTPQDQRLDKESLDELIAYKSSVINEQIIYLKGEISKINTQIVSLEGKSTIEFKTTLESKISQKKNEFTTHLSVKPLPPLSGGQSDNNQEVFTLLDDLRKKIANLELEIASKEKERTDETQKKEELKRAQQHYITLDSQLKKLQSETAEYVIILKKYGLNPDNVFQFNINTLDLAIEISRIDARLETINAELDSSKSESLRTQLSNLEEELASHQEKLDAPAKNLEKYLDDLRVWESQERNILGSVQQEGTLAYYESQLKYLVDQLPIDLEARYQQRNSLVTEIFNKKIALSDIRKELFSPVMKFIDEFEELRTRYNVKIDVSLELKSFPEAFLNYINLGKIGSFNGTENANKQITEIIGRANFDASNGFINFTNDILSHLRHDKRTPANTPVSIGNQLKNGTEISTLYDYLFSFDYLLPVYNLKLGTKTLQELSPGERGALLLIFYLILDNDDIPLVIDQPEENLDNESVYHILVHFIKKVKEKRQIIIVTHNPNLAIVCDADQIIQMQIEKENKNLVKYFSGAIENEIINKAVINILEGTLPAFNNRDSKYAR